MSRRFDEPREVASLREHLCRLGAEEVSHVEEGRFEERVFILPPMTFRARREYDVWLVDAAGSDGSFVPASFWVQALSGVVTLPEPIVDLSWVEVLDADLERVVATSESLLVTVRSLTNAYEARLAARFMRPSDGDPPT